jgi:hypothetical protein
MRMQTEWMRLASLVLFSLIVGCGGGGGGDDDDVPATPAASATVFGLTSTGNLISFGAESPATLLSNIAITGLGPGESLVGMDFRPATGQLFGLSIDAGSMGRVYTLNTATGAATVLTMTPFALTGTDFGFDFNPAVDRIRIVSNTGQNLRANPNDGARVGAGDTALTGGSVVVGSAYDRNFSTGGLPGATASVTTLFGIDSMTNRLVQQGGVDGSPSPDLGAITDVGLLGVDPSSEIGFDIHGNTGVAAASLVVAPATTSSLYAIDLATGAATLVGPIGSGLVVRGLAIQTPPPTVAFATTSGGSLVSFLPSTPGTILSLNPITGLQAGDVIRGIDFRPATQDLVALASGAAPAGSARLYRINTTTAVATLLNTLAADPADGSVPYTTLMGAFFGVDFNPVPDRLRVVSDANQNLRINVDATQGTTTDTGLNGVVGATVVASGYTNSFSGTTTTALFGIDTSTIPDQLVRQAPPNDGVLTAVGPLGVDAVDNNVGFDIVGGGRGLSLATINLAGPVGSVYRINLDTGVATLGPNNPINTGGTGAVTGFAVQLRDP